MTTSPSKTSDRHDEHALHRWEGEGGCLGVAVRPRRDESRSDRRQGAAARRRNVTEKSSAASASQKHLIPEESPRRGAVLLASTSWNTEYEPCPR